MTFKKIDTFDRFGRNVEYFLLLTKALQDSSLGKYSEYLWMG